MKCPHCQTGFKEKWKEKKIGSNDSTDWKVKSVFCPTCDKIIVKLVDTSSILFLGEISHHEIVVYPKKTPQVTLDPIIDKKFADDYNEASIILDLSPKASAALSRRCLQNLLIEKANVKPDSLSKQIQEVLDSKQLPQTLADDVDEIRKIGNFAAHPTKSKHTGVILDVDEGEAEWSLEILKELFDHYIVNPSNSAQRKKKLAKKLSKS